MAFVLGFGFDFGSGAFGSISFEIFMAMKPKSKIERYTNVEIKMCSNAFDGYFMLNLSAYEIIVERIE